MEAPDTLNLPEWKDNGLKQRAQRQAEPSVDDVGHIQDHSRWKQRPGNRSDWEHTPSYINQIYIF